MTVNISTLNIHSVINLMGSFCKDFNVSKKLIASENWRTGRKIEIENEIEVIQARLDAGGFKRAARRETIEIRNNLQQELQLDDPAIIPLSTFDLWMESEDLIDDMASSADYAYARNAVKTAFLRAIRTSFYTISGLPVFLIDAEGRTGYLKIKTPGLRHEYVVGKVESDILQRIDSATEQMAAARNDAGAYNQLSPEMAMFSQLKDDLGLQLLKKVTTGILEIMKGTEESIKKIEVQRNELLESVNRLTDNKINQEV
jgi:hypothetical protein